jgi:chorismate synthase
MSSTFGTLLKVSTFGESHCKGVGAVLDGCPPGMALGEADIQPQLDRRRPGQSKLTTDRQEADRVTIFSGVENGITLGTPIGLFVPNKDQRPGDYRQMSRIPRPSHADFTYQMKYGVRASSGGGRSSARETIGRVAAGAVAEKMLKEAYGVEIVAWVSAVNDISSATVDVQTITRQMVDGNLIRCPDAAAAEKWKPWWPG